MKNSTKNQGLVFLAVIIICNSGSKLPLNSKADQELSGNDSLIPFVKPSYQEIYSTDYKWTEMIGILKHDSSTKIEFYSLKNNICLSFTEWGLKENMSLTYAMHWGSLIEYDVNCKLVELRPAQKKQIIQSVRISLDSIMQHFPGYIYSFKWI